MRAEEIFMQEISCRRVFYLQGAEWGERIPGEHRAPGVGHSDPFLHPGTSVTQLTRHFNLHIATKMHKN